MMFLTAKVDMKKIAMILGAIAVVIVALILLLGGGEKAQSTAAPTVSNNDARVEFLKKFGWQVSSSPVESSQVRIPEERGEVFDRYNQLQKSQNYDLTQYGGKNVMRYVYKVNNYPNATEPVYATLLIYKNEIIGGDVTDSAPNGQIRGFKMPEKATKSTMPSTTPSVSTLPTESSLPETAR